MNLNTSSFIRFSVGQAIILGVSAIFLLSCEKKATDHSEQRNGERVKKSHDRSIASSENYPRNQIGRPPTAVRVNNDFSAMIAENEWRLESLIEYCIKEVPDSEKVDFMISAAGAAGREGNTEFIKRLLELNPGSIKNLGIESYARNTNGNAAISQVFELASQNLLPEEKEAIWKGIVTPLINLPSRDLATLFGAGIPTEFQDRVSNIIGINLGSSDPKEAKSIIQSYPSQIQKKIESTYWRQLGATNPEVAKLAFEAGNVPEEAWTEVGRNIINPIIRDESLDAALNYALARESEKQQEDLANYVFDLWMKNDSIVASQRAAQLQPGPARDGAARAIALRMEKLGERESAEQWRALIQRK